MRNVTGSSFAKPSGILLRLALLLALLVPASLPLSAEKSAIAFARARHLQHGINASMWFAQARDYSPQRLATYTTAADIQLMHQLGFDHVRLSIDAEALTRDPALPGAPDAGLSQPFVAQLDAAVHTMLAYHLAVIIDMHPSEAYKQQLRTDPGAADRFVQMWSALARHYSSTDPERVFFEILNEPEFTDAAPWMDVQTRAAAAIRAAAPQHTMIATALHYSGLEDLLPLAPLADPNVIYTFHDYEPFPFTHQGATWTTDKVRPLRGVPYPSSPEAVTPLLDQEQNDSNRFWLNTYGWNRWNAARITSELGFAARWSKEHDAPVYCGEFGVFRAYADPAMRAAWIHDVRTALESYGIGWAMWDYSGSFGLVEKVNGKAVPETTIVRALGLHGAE